MVERHIWRELDFFLIGCMLALLTISLLSVHSATLNAVTGNGKSLAFLFPRHIINIGVGVVAMVIMTTLDYRLLSGLAVPIYIGVVVVLGIVLVIGKITEGAQSWLEVGTRTVQPSEFAKLLVIIVMASYWSHFEEKRQSWLIQLGGLMLVGIPLLLTLLQPDFGTATVYGMIWLTMAWCVGIRWWQLLLVMLLAIPMVLVGWEVVLDYEQKSRLMTFYYLLTDPGNVDPNDGYNIIQSLNAIGSGGMFGTGLTQGIMSQGNYVPVQHTDFIFAVVGEEMGFVGGVVLLTFQALLLWLTLSIAQKARDLFGRMIAIGIFGMIFSHVLVNVGMTISLLPVTGIPLPFISYGGSFTITSFMAIGLLQSVKIRWRKIAFRDSQQLL